jgi:UDP-3-O-[3-hydroxymyristoyl] glucosamine N-acyltransferase
MLSVSELAGQIDAELIGDGSINIKAIAPIEVASQGDITFVTGEKYLSMLQRTSASAVISFQKIEGCAKPQLITKDVKAAILKTLELFAVKVEPPQPSIDKTAIIAEGSQVASDASIGPGVVLACGVKIGSKTVISAGCKIGENTVIGNNTRLDFNVAVYHNCSIGNNCIIMANTTIGSTGFGYVFLDNQHKLVPHNGGVIIEDFVDIGANCAIDRAKFENTVIGAGTKIDNLVHIAHNVVIGKCCLITGQVGIAGSSRIGNGVVLAGQVGIKDNVSLGDGVIVGAKGGVMNNIEAGRTVLGQPAIDYSEKLRQVAATQNLPTMAKQLKKLLKRMDAVEAAKDNKQ